MGKFTGNCRTTAMGILPHVDLSRALELALSVDIPFWPQLPRYSFYEDMYVQVSERFPGMRINEREQRVLLHLDAFYEELMDYAVKSEDEEIYKLSPAYSTAFAAFLDRDLSSYYAIRGQSIGPLSYGLKITTTDLKPIIYNDEVKEFLFDFIARKVNVQYRQLKEKHPRAFVWVDEPGLEILFGSFTGYPSHRAKEDFARFLDSLEGPRGVHLCGNPDWSFLLSGLDLDILSMDAFGNGEIFTRYAGEVKDFLERGGILCWGIVPTLTEELTAESISSLAGRLESLWDYLVERGVDRELILRQAWLAPARCCLINPDGYETVERAFATLRGVAAFLQKKYGLENPCSTSQ
ncbi:MAG: hypothetical protein IMW93_00860 [Thermoanaerobacteraceae bacterium]|nr:hypothetical protein [Thermoanaerobacteraceae bacterium]